ncbi:unnamed protein product [Bursaphelenchus xylophilus]|uniref:Jumonji domain-containing protein 4 n=1 Tax=Bursaphelenchus xylophilus TaxID=6326 RepID=A0A1I7SSY5_BURXY|nr:unnamed protein product [Bursaphelenchus xylophilus]CAG9108837.1 unnamed protein product [Bursaphelenchus xylophilus]
MKRNEPVIISNAIRNWKASRFWVNTSGTPDWKLLKTIFGNVQVPITTDGNCLQKRIPFSEFVSNLSDDHSYQFYLKDWHFCLDSRENWYEIPSFLRLDWVNNKKEVAENDIFRGDYRFCYIGGSSTWTGFHADVMNSYSWSANICGRKRWIMIPKTVTKIRNVHLEDIEDIRKFDWKSVGGIEFEQIRGEIVFVPSGWYHQVHNMEITISINHNWINQFNIEYVIDLLLERLKEVKKEVTLMGSDVDDPVATVEKLLRDDYGLNLGFAQKLLEIMAHSSESGDLVADSQDVNLIKEKENICKFLLNRVIGEQTDLLELHWFKE